MFCYINLLFSHLWNMQVEWRGYFDEVFADTSVFINDEETIIVREPEYLDGLLPILIATPENVVGNYVN